MTQKSAAALRALEQDTAEKWFTDGWRSDPPEQVTFGRIMMMAAKGREKQRQIPHEIIELAQTNLYRRTAPAIDELRREQREAMDALHKRGLRIY